MKRLLALILFFFVSTLMSNSTWADFRKTKIAVLDFELQGKGYETPDMGKIVAEWLITSLVREGRFEVLERRLLQKILNEQKLSASGAVEERSAIKLGKLLGVENVVSGSVVKLQDSIEVNARIIDVESASIIAAERVKSSTAVRLEELIYKMAEKIIRDFPLEGFIVRKGENNVVIDLGKTTGIEPNMQFIVFKEGNVIKHPKTGEVLDVEQIQTGVIEIKNVRDKISEATILNETPSNPIEYGQMVKCTEKPITSDKGRLYVDTDPKDAHICILNIRPRFKQGIWLENGKYLLEVSAAGYQTKKMWLEISSGRDKKLTVRLVAQIRPTDPLAPGVESPLPMLPIVLMVVSGNETMIIYVQAYLESIIVGSGLRLISVSEIPTLRENMQYGEMPITWNGIRQFVPKGKVNVLLLAHVQKTGSMPLKYYGRTQELITASFYVRAHDMVTGTSAARPAIGSVKFTTLNMEENFTEALNSAASGIGAEIKGYWKQKVKRGKAPGQD